MDALQLHGLADRAGEDPLVFLDAPDWHAGAACADVDREAFFTTTACQSHAHPRGQALDAARAVCAACPVAERCLAWALDHDEVGVWGGTTTAERKALRRDAAAA